MYIHKCMYIVQECVQLSQASLLRERERERVCVSVCVCVCVCVCAHLCVCVCVVYLTSLHNTHEKFIHNWPVSCTQLL